MSKKDRLKPTERSKDYFVHERKYDVPAHRLDDPYVQLALTREKDGDINLSDMTFDEFLESLNDE